MKKILFLILVSLQALAGCSQGNSQKENKIYGRVGGSCEGCEAVHESPVPFEKLPSVITLPGYDQPGPKMEISGIVYLQDGKTPAKDVVIYVYHTDQSGHYPAGPEEKGWGKRHGKIRGWLKTDKNGYYKFITTKPAAYPGRKDPAHIHISIKEPDKNEYWVDAYLFDDDPLLTKEMIKNEENRGGSGIIHLENKNGVLHGARNIILGKNVPDYPVKPLPKISSGLSLGANCPAFDPLHFSGSDSGKYVCPMCKYGYGQGVMIWFNHANLDQMKDMALKLEKEMGKRGEKKLRVFLVYMNPFYNQNSKEEEEILRKKIREWCDKQGLKRVAMVGIPSPVDEETAGIYKINPEAKNTVFVYKKRKISEKWVNIEYDDASLNSILKQFN